MDTQSPIRVAMVVRRVHPAHGPGGLERHAHDLASNLARAGVELDLFAETPASADRMSAAAASFPSGVTLRWVPGRWLPIGDRQGTVVLDRSTNYPLWSLRVARRILRELQTHGPARWAVVHVHGLAGWGLARAARKGRLPRPLVLTTQGLEEFRSHVRAKRWAYLPFRAGQRTVARESDIVVATDASLQPLVERHLRVPVSRQVVIPNAVDPQRCRALGERARGLELLDRFGLARASPLFLSVGRVESNKGFELLVAALARAAPRLAGSWAWVLIGDGPRRQAIEKAIAAAGLGRAVLAGRLPERDLHSLYAVADWFVHPTLYEGSSLATLEAMAHGLPVIASRAGGLPDKVQDEVSGLLVPPGDVAALMEALVRTRGIPGKSWGQAGQRLCETAFSWDTAVRQYITLYETLLTHAQP